MKETTINPIMEKSLTWYNYINAKKLEDIKANIECQLWSDVTELNHLEFSARPEIPEYVKPKVEKHNFWEVFFRGVKQFSP